MGDALVFREEDETLEGQLSRDIFKAISNNDADFLQERCAEASRLGLASALTRANEHGVTPLILAARQGHAACASTLVERGVDIHYINPVPASADSKNLGSALHEAAHKGSEGIVSLLLLHGANPWAASVLGPCAYDYALLSGNKLVEETIRKHSYYCGPVKVKCVVFKVTRLTYCTYKSCTALVTPFLPYNPFNPQSPIKRVYLFSAFDTPSVILSYDAADCCKTKTGKRAELRMYDADNRAVFMPGGDNMQTFQDICSKGALASSVGGFMPVGTGLMLAQLAGGWNPGNLHLMVDGRKAYSLRPDPAFPPPEYSSVYFRPKGSIAEFDKLLEHLVDKSNRQLYRAMYWGHLPPKPSPT